MRTPHKEREINGGIQRLYRFPNGYGASVIKGPYTYGGLEGLWELAVTKATGADPEHFQITYSTPITDGVEGRLTEDEVDVMLSQIEALPHEKIPQ
jgi:hypothetical protein